MNVNNLLLALSVAVISACGGGGGGSSSGTTQTPVAANISTATMAAGVQPWFHTYMKISDGSEILVLTTMGPNAQALSNPTPVLMAKANSTGAMDVTDHYFTKAPNIYWGRNIVAFNDPKTDLQSLWFCNHGREVGSYKDAATPRINGIWGEQDLLFTMQNGKFIDQTLSLPQSNDFTHGCASASIGDENSLVFIKNTLGVFDGNPSTQIFKKINNSFVNMPFDPSILSNDMPTWWVGKGDFLKNGKDAIVFGQQVVSFIGNSYQVTQILKAPALEEQGYKNYQNGLVGDLNGDGYPDVIEILSGDGISKPFLSGAMLAVFINDGHGRLQYSASAIPTHQPTDFGLDLRIIDINFDGKMDIVSSGPKYGYQLNESIGDWSTTIVLVNNGDGTFSKKKIADAELNIRCAAAGILVCGRGTYFMASGDKNSYNLLMSGANSSSGKWILYGRSVTINTPLVLD